MLLRHLIINRYLEAVQENPKLHALLENAGVALMAAAKLAKTDHDKADRIDLEQLADIITAIKLLTNADYRDAMTKQDIGIDSTNATELFKMLDSIPNDPAKDLPAATRSFVRSVALMSKSVRAKELEALKLLVSSDHTKRQAAQAELDKLAALVSAALKRLKAKVDAHA